MDVEQAKALLGDLTDIAVLVTFVGALAFVFSYAAFFNWRSTAPGRAIMYLFSSLIAVSVLALMQVWLGPDYPWRSVVRAVVWWLVAAAMFRLLWVLWSNYHRGGGSLEVHSKQKTKGNGQS